ncbi:MAG: VOC family protein [Oscillospiraceae bacterium]|nr:VOC family protein [Oscillospiraceae bacterium]
MKFIHSTLTVKNLEESLKFYHEALGLPIDARFSAGTHEIVFLGGGGTKIELIGGEAGHKTDAGRDISWGFEVSSLEETRERLAALGIAAGDTVSPHAGVRFFFIKDPDGMTIQLVEQEKA